MCDECDVLRERIVQLESELRQQPTVEARQALSMLLAQRGKPYGRPQIASFIAALHAAWGRPLSANRLLMLIPPHNHHEDERFPEIVKQWACWARKAIGGECIRTIHGVGYCLTPEGLAKVDFLLAYAARAHFRTAA